MSKIFTITEGLENLGAIRTGGQASVYKGRRIGEIITAVKLLPTPIHSESPEDKHFADFRNEVDKLIKANEEPNPNVVKILSSGITETGNLPFIEMEFIEGPDLEELLQPPYAPVFTILDAIRVAEHLSCALAHCHNLDIKHGDIKSNNVKLNVHSGNYVLLDFGMAVMTDEERRTSLRHAGAIEYMAPEQNEGVLLVQTDVYSFGIVLYQILAGEVPFPLTDKTETMRNRIMMAHLEKDPPDLLLLRRERLPSDWDEAKRESEMLVPEWLLATIAKCLQKKPEDRFPDGKALHAYIHQNRIRVSAGDQAIAGRLTALQDEHIRLKKSYEQLEHQLKIYKDSGPVSQPIFTSAAPAGNGVSRSAFGLVLTLAVLLGLFAGYAYFSRPPQTAAQQATDTTGTTVMQAGPRNDEAITGADPDRSMPDTHRASTAGRTNPTSDTQPVAGAGSGAEEEPAATSPAPVAATLKEPDTARKASGSEAAEEDKQAAPAPAPGHADSTAGGNQ